MKLMILNCSGKAEISNSQYFTEKLIECFQENKANVEYDIYYVFNQDKNEIIDKAINYDTILCLSPAYFGTLPAFALEFLREFELRYTGDKNKNVYVITNGAFFNLKSKVDIVTYQLWTEKMGFAWKGYLRISAGELMLVSKKAPKDVGKHRDMFIKMDEFAKKIYKGEYIELTSYPKCPRIKFLALGIVFWYVCGKKGDVKPKYLMGKDNR